MGKLIYSMSVSLDGFIETSRRELDWIIVDDELHTFFNDQARETAAFLYGRRLYEVMVDYWPTADANPSAPKVEVDFARIWRAKPKVAFSRTLDKVEWNGRLVKDNIVQEAAKLKEQYENDLALGGPTIASTFIQLGLIDEFRLFVNPIVLGAGAPFFPSLVNPINLALVETRRFDSGVVYLRYRLQPAVRVQAAEPE